MKESAQQLSLDSSYRSTHFVKIGCLLDLDTELLREEFRIRSTLAYIQGMILPNMDAMQKHIAHAKTLVHDNNFSIADHMMKLSAEL